MELDGINPITANHGAVILCDSGWFSGVFML
jgi:hypothetical protein